MWINKKSISILQFYIIKFYVLDILGTIYDLAAKI